MVQFCRTERNEKIQLVQRAAQTTAQPTMHQLYSVQSAELEAFRKTPVRFRFFPSSQAFRRRWTRE